MEITCILVTWVNRIRYRNKATSEKRVLVGNLSCTKIDVVIEVMDSTSNDKSQTHSNRKVAIKLLKVEEKFIPISTLSMFKINNSLVNAHEVSDLKKKFRAMKK